jgi:hypothetical protein
MSIEAKIEALTSAVHALTAQLAQLAQLQSVNVVAPAPLSAPVAAPVAALAPIGTLGSAMPAPPAFVAPAPAAAPSAAGAPFANSKGLIDYVMGAYRALGPQKGAQIQGVLTGLGYQNINDVKPEHYGQFFAGVEALKG